MLDNVLGIEPTIDNGCTCIEVGSGKQREDAHRFYEREGFVCDHYKFTKGFERLKEL
jgi:hypothetical protein